MLLGEFAQGPLAARHDLAGGGHLRVEIRFGRGQLDAVRREDDRKGFAHLRVEMGEQFLGQDDPGAVADPGDLQGRVHTGVITCIQVQGKRACRLSVFAQNPRKLSGRDELCGGAVG
jgi:hypothetical protein